MRSRLRFFCTVALASLSLQACATVRLYPVCQYAGAVDDSAFDVYSDSISDLLSAMRIGAGPSSAVLLLDRRYLVVRADPWQHRNLRARWKDLGCLGRYSAPEDRARYSACRQFVETAVAMQEPGIAEDAVLCFSEEACQLRGRAGPADAVIYCNGSKAH